MSLSCLKPEWLLTTLRIKSVPSPQPAKPWMICSCLPLGLHLLSLLPATLAFFQITSASCSLHMLAPLSRTFCFQIYHGRMIASPHSDLNQTPLGELSRPQSVSLTSSTSWSSQVLDALRTTWSIKLFSNHYLSFSTSLYAPWGQESCPSCSPL